MQLRKLNEKINGIKTEIGVLYIGSVIKAPFNVGTVKGIDFKEKCLTRNTVHERG